MGFCTHEQGRFKNSCFRTRHGRDNLVRASWMWKSARPYTFRLSSRRHLTKASSWRCWSFTLVLWIEANLVWHVSPPHYADSCTIQVQSSEDRSLQSALSYPFVIQKPDQDTWVGTKLAFIDHAIVKCNAYSPGGLIPWSPSNVYLWMPVNWDQQEDNFSKRIGLQAVSGFVNKNVSSDYFNNTCSHSPGLCPWWYHVIIWW